MWLDLKKIRKYSMSWNLCAAFAFKSGFICSCWSHVMVYQCFHHWWAQIAVLQLVSSGLDSDDVGDISSSFTKDHPIQYCCWLLTFIFVSHYLTFTSMKLSYKLMMRTSSVLHTKSILSIWWHWMKIVGSLPLGSCSVHDTTPAAPVTFITSIHLLIVEAGHIWCVVDPHS